MKRFIYVLCSSLILILGSMSMAHSTEVLGNTAGDGDDANGATFHFDADNVNFQMTQPDGTALTTNQVTYNYGTAFGLFQNNADYVNQRGLQVLGSNLTGSNWATYTYPPKDNVAVDPATGQMKFSTMGSWQTAVGVDKNDSSGISSNDPDIAVNDNGEALAVWGSIPASTERILAARYTPGSGWYEPVTIDAGIGNNCIQPEFVLNNAGQAVCVWADSTAGRIYAANYTSGIGWYQPVTIDAGAIGTAVTPKVAINSAGTAMCVFVQNDGSYDRIYATRYTTASGWGTAVTVQANALDYDADSPDVAMDGSGNALVVFNQVYNGSANVGCYANRYTASGWKGAVRIDNNSTNSTSEPIALMDDAGQMTGIFVQSDGAGVRLYANQYSDTWQVNPTAIDAASITYAVQRPHGDINSSGDIVCVYQQNDGSYDRIWAVRYTVANGWYGAVTVDANNSNNAAYPWVAINDYGHIVVSFEGIQGLTRAYTNQYIPTQGWQQAEFVSLEHMSSLYLPRPVVALNNSGKSFCLFSQNLIGIAPRMFAAELLNAVPYGELNVNYNYMPSPTPTAATSQNDVQVSNRKIQPNLGQQVTVSYDTTKAGLVSIKVYDMQGELVKVLQDEYHNAGSYSCQWGGQTLNNALVASGVYIIHIKTPDTTKTQKVVVIK